MTKYPEQKPEEQSSQEMERAARLSAEPTQEPLPTTMERVERLLRAAPLVMPAADFAERVVEAIRHQQVHLNRYSATGVALGLTMATLVVASFVAALMMGIITIAINWSQIFQAAVLALGAFSGLVSGAVSDASQSVVESPLMTAAAVASVPLLGMWLWIVRRLSSSEADA